MGESSSITAVCSMPRRDDKNIAPSTNCSRHFEKVDPHGIGVAFVGVPCQRHFGVAHIPGHHRNLLSLDHV